jgi:uncharacterized protein (DUF58 family)
MFLKIFILLVVFYLISNILISLLFPSLRLQRNWMFKKRTDVEETYRETQSFFEENNK